MNQRLLKVPTWKARMACVKRVKRTLRVHMRLRGSLRRGLVVWTGFVAGCGMFSRS